MKPFLFLLCATLLGLGGCKSRQEPPDVTGIKWELKTIHGKEVKLEDPENSIFMLFDHQEQRVNGRATCNRFFGAYKMTATKLEFSAMGATRMACLHDGEWEREFFSMLEEVETFDLDGDTLTFISGDGPVATFHGIKIKEATHRQ